MDGGVAAGLGTFIVSWLLISRLFVPGFHRNRLALLDQLTKLDTQSRKDSWRAIRSQVHRNLSEPGGRKGISRAQSAKKYVERAYKQGSSDARKALAELASLKKDT